MTKAIIITITAKISNWPKVMAGKAATDRANFTIVIMIVAIMLAPPLQRGKPGASYLLSNGHKTVGHA